MTDEKVWKVQIQGGGIQHVWLPRGAQFLDIQRQGSEVVAWALVDPSRPLEERQLLVAPTGGTLLLDPDRLCYLATVQFEDAGTVWHVFRVLAVAEPRAAAPPLPRRLRQIAERVADGKSNKEIGRELGISDQTVKNHLTDLFHRLNLPGRVGVAIWWLEHGRHEETIHAD